MASRVHFFCQGWFSEVRDELVKTVNFDMVLVESTLHTIRTLSCIDSSYIVTVLANNMIHHSIFKSSEDAVGRRRITRKVPSKTRCRVPRIYMGHSLSGLMVKTPLNKIVVEINHILLISSIQSGSKPDFWCSDLKSYKYICQQKYKKGILNQINILRSF